MMQQHERQYLASSLQRHARLVAEAEKQRALRELHGGGFLRRARTRAAALLRRLATRLEPELPNGRGSVPLR